MPSDDDIKGERGGTIGERESIEEEGIGLEEHLIEPDLALMSFRPFDVKNKIGRPATAIARLAGWLSRVYIYIYIGKQPRYGAGFITEVTHGQSAVHSRSGHTM